MTPHRDDRETLLAENERLRAEVASLRAKPAKAPAVPMRWAHPSFGDNNAVEVFTSALVIAWIAIVVLSTVVFVGTGTDFLRWPVLHRLVGVLATLTLAWCLAFVRRVPR